MQYGVGLSQAKSNSAAFIGATAVSYFLNTRWTFDADSDGQTIARFLLVTLVGMTWSAFLGYLADRYDWILAVTIVITLATAPPATYWLHKHWTYARIDE